MTEVKLANNSNNNTESNNMNFSTKTEATNAINAADMNGAFSPVWSDSVQSWNIISNFDNRIITSL